MHMQTHYPSLLVVLNSQKALWFFLKENGVELVEELEEKKERYTDYEAHFSASGTGSVSQSGAADVDNKRNTEALHKHIKNIAKKTKELWKNNNFAHISVVTPELYKHSITSEITSILPNQNILLVFGNHVNTPVQEMKELFLQSLRVK